jgi:hypothetical protein
MTRVYSLVFVSICVATICLTGTASVHAVSIFSDSFEEGGGTGYVALPDNNGLSIHGLNGWVKNDVNFNSVLYYDPVTFDVRLPGTTGDNIQGPLPHGGQALYTVNGASATNTLGTTTVAGTTYTLSVRIGDSANDATAGNADLTLLFGGLPVATATGSPPINPDSIGSNTFTYAFGTLTTSFVALTSGQSIGIKLDNLGPTGNIIYFDSVLLDAEAAPPGVPEPSTFVLAALGLAGLGLVAWRRRK